MTCACASKDCAGRLEWHHCLSKNRLKREFKYGARRAFTNEPWRPAGRTLPVTDESASKWPFTELTLDRILGDTRNRVWLCHHHHELCTNGRLKVQLPESVWAFARDYGLVGMLENDLRKAA